MVSKKRETKVISNKCFFPLINLDDNQNPAKKEPKTNRERARQKLVNLLSKKKKSQSHQASDKGGDN